MENVSANSYWGHPVVQAINEAIKRGLDHVFFQDGLAADLHEMSPAEAYREGWRDAWLEMADDLADAANRHSKLDATSRPSYPIKKPGEDL